MKKILYILLAFSATLLSCQKQDIEPEVGGQNIKYEFLSGSADVSDAKLVELVKPLHLFVLQNNDLSKIIVQKEFASIADITPIKLNKGVYQFLYISNVKTNQIKYSAGVNKMTIYAPMRGDSVFSAGDIFAGIDEDVDVGEKTESKTSLERVVGGVDLTISGLNNSTVLKSVKLLNSMYYIATDGDDDDDFKGETKPVFFEMKKQSDGNYKGFVTAFETLDDQKAIIEIEVESKGVVTKYPVELNNSVSQNKIMSVDAKAKGMPNVWDIKTTVVPWGDKIIEDIEGDLIYNKEKIIRSIEFDLTNTDIEEFDMLRFNLLFLGQYYTPMQFDSNQILFAATDSSRTCKVDGFSLYVDDYTYISDITFVRRSDNGIVYRTFKRFKVDFKDGEKYSDMKIILPAVSTALSEGDQTAMFDLRKSVKEVYPNYYNSLGWSSDDVSEWKGVVLSEDGTRVIAIGSDYSSNANPLSYESNNAKTKTKSQIGISLSSSFTNLTELVEIDFRRFGFDIIEELPSGFDKLTKLRRLVLGDYKVSNMPKLPDGLKYLNLYSTEISTLDVLLSLVPSNIEQLILELPSVSSLDGDFSKFVNIYDFGFYTTNPLETVNVDFGKMPNLMYVTLNCYASDNCKLPMSVFKAKNSVSITGFAKFTLHKTDVNSSSLKFLYLSNKYVDSDDLKALRYSELQSIQLSSNDSIDNYDWLGDISTLTNISIDRSPKFVEVPNAFNNLPILRGLTFYDNLNMKGGLPGRLLEKYKSRSLSVSHGNCGTFIPIEKTL